jgi:hypothetical protein
MGIKKIIEVLNAMQADGVIGGYAIAGAVAAYAYIEAAVTRDLDILVTFEEMSSSGLISLAPIFSYLSKKGYTQHEGEGLIVEGWPVQFLPVANDLQNEALAEAEDIEIRVEINETVTARVLKPEHLVAICLSVGRSKDLARIEQFLNEGEVDIETLCGLLSRHDLRFAWQMFCAKMNVADPCDSTRTQ